MQSILREEGRPLLLYPTYLSMIQGSTGSRIWRKLCVRGIHGEAVDVIRNGDLACAFFVSSILALLHLTREGVHTTVTETEADMQASGWQRTEKPVRGDVLIWGQKFGTDGKNHRHIGFYWDQKRAISNVASYRSPRYHVLHLGTGKGYRKIEAIYHHDALDA